MTKTIPAAVAEELYELLANHGHVDPTVRTDETTSVDGWTLIGSQATGNSRWHADYLLIVRDDTGATWGLSYGSTGVSPSRSPPPGYVVVDQDGELDPGVEFPDTLTFKTGKGWHRVYRDPDALIEQTQTNNPYWTNVDTRISGRGYIVLPPSIHGTGSIYSVVNWLVRVCDFPYQLLSLSKRKERNSDKRLVEKRNGRLCSRGCRAGRGGSAVVPGFSSPVRGKA
jgi:hypothetical protein